VGSLSIEILERQQPSPRLDHVAGISPVAILQKTRRSTGVPTPGDRIIQNSCPSFSGDASSTSPQLSSSLRCSAVSLAGVPDVDADGRSPAALAERGRPWSRRR